jgi:hypothetical protein
MAKHKPAPRASINRPNKPPPKHAHDHAKAKHKDAKAPAKHNGKSKTYQPLLHPPPGSYDPALDAALRASKRGLGDVQFDTETNRERSASDYITALGDIGRQKDELRQDTATQRGDVEQGYQRNLGDLLQQRGYTQQDYQSSIDALNRNYAQLGDAQRQAGNARGLLDGGYQAQAARKRAANQAIEKAPMDTAFSRALAASQTGEQRLGEDRSTTLRDLVTQSTRGRQALNRQGGLDSQQYQRGSQDLTTQLTRANRENTAFGLDTGSQKLYQALQSGALTPASAKAVKLKLSGPQPKKNARPKNVPRPPKLKKVKVR